MPRFRLCQGTTLRSSRTPIVALQDKEREDGTLSEPLNQLARSCGSVSLCRVESTKRILNEILMTETLRERRTGRPVPTISSMRQSSPGLANCVPFIQRMMEPPGSHLIGSPKDLKNAFERESFTKTCHIKKTHQDAVDFAFFAHQALRSLFPEAPETVAFQTPLITHPSKSSRPRELGNSRPSRPQLPPPVAHVSVPGSRPDSTKHNPRPLRSSRSRREVLRNRNRVRSRPSEETLVH
ncbi:unnamed protein product [Nesidiocoris tenuis]|uniref:Uncharacterized protein n=1 Tax=Nesidiocoris tenuis TaxID=355587 RepID=A0A6H5HLP2_9HEMI|nr:unnamed protein product [Nesidiocoris tenuis]CAB0019222.1 unnamed protein product [Nesidiocoris tenuis]